MSNILSGQNIKGRLDVFEISSTFSRPADTTAYVDGDGISDNVSSGSASNLSFLSVALSAGQGFRLNYATITSDNGASSPPSLQLWLFTQNPTALADNAAYTITDAENNTVPMVISLSQSFTSNNNWRLESGIIGRDIKTDTILKSVFGNIKVIGPYTPASGETFKVTLGGDYL